MVSPAPPGSPADLPWAVFGRRVKPLALAASVANLSIAVGISEINFDSVPALIVMTLAIIGLLSFWVGWWCNTTRMVQVGLILTVGLFATRGAFSGLSLGWMDHEVWLSASWCMAAGGAFLLERRAPHSYQPEAYGGMQ